MLEAARAEIRKATGGNPPPVLDPFCGGGSIPLEAQRLGLEANASDLNPVAVLITKALVEIPPKFAGRPPVNLESRQKLAHLATWKGVQGLAEDLRHYGKWMRDEAFKRIGHIYPKVKLPKGGEATVIAWLWARTVKCPNPACGAQMPLVRSFALSTKKGKETYVEPIIDSLARTVRFEVRRGADVPEAPKAGRGATFRCLICSQIADDRHIKHEGTVGGMGAELMAIVAQAGGDRIYVSPTQEHVDAARRAEPQWEPPGQLADDPRNIWCVSYGLTRFVDLFTSRQLVSLATFSDLVLEARDRVLADGEDKEYADAVATYLAFAVDKAADRNTSLCSWESRMDRIRNTFGRQALPMVWDYAETNPFAGAGGDIQGTVKSLSEVLDELPNGHEGRVTQLDATAAIDGVEKPTICTDPPYYDNISYADLSDFFYVWLRRSLKTIYPDLFSTIMTPKGEELIATPYRFGGNRDEAERFFERGLRRAFARMHGAQHYDYPVTLFYAFRQAEADDGAGGLVSTGWDTMLTGLLASGFTVTGTWPMRSELATRNIGRGTNALASSIVLVCRPRPVGAGVTARRDFVSALRAELPEALRKLQHGNVAPVDLAQAAIGPGMAVFSRYVKVVEADGTAMTVRSALALINQALDEILAEQEGDFDADTRFAVTWFEQRGTGEGLYGEADVLARAKNTSVAGMEQAGILRSRAGKVHLLSRDELSDRWDPAADRRITVWEVAQYLIKRLEEGGEDAAADLLHRVGGLGETARELAYRLYTTCERKGWAQEALSYNALVVAWPEIARRVAGTPEAEAQQTLEV